MRLYELTKPEAYKKYGSREKVRSARSPNDLQYAISSKDPKAKNRARGSGNNTTFGINAPLSQDTRSRGVKKDRRNKVDKTGLGTTSNRLQRVDPSLTSSMGITGRQGPWRLLDLVDVTARTSGRRQGVGKTGVSKAELDKLVDRQLLRIEWKPEATPILSQQSGVYIWLHPKWGIFYIGIVGSNLPQRWNTHIQKLMGRLHDSAEKKSPEDKKEKGLITTAPIEWLKFSKKFLSSEGSQLDITDEQIKKELDDVAVAFYPIVKPKGIGTSTRNLGKRSKDDYEQWKKGIEDLEARRVKSIVHKRVKQGKELPTNSNAEIYKQEIEDEA
jgi:hypothetical protein